ncbi:MAG: hypothetical protein H0V19_02515 [Euzebyales bacterium]|nr:hypothetical protein [Euzebyales bacterium]
MTTIKATCPACGEVPLTPGDIELRVHPADVTGSFYAFTCPTCGGNVRKPADDRVVRLLVSGGVEAQQLTVTPPPRRLGQRFDGPALTHDDLLDFHGLLARDDWFDRLQAADLRKNVA